VGYFHPARKNAKQTPEDDEAEIKSEDEENNELAGLTVKSNFMLKPRANPRESQT
jgi:hypothetical protein